jgi:GTPase SAR1 family protein
MRRAISIDELLAKQYDTFKLSDPFYQAFGEPERTGVWMVVGNSGNGKTSFVLQLCKELCNHSRIIYNSLEEGDCKTMQDAFKKTDMKAVRGQLILTSEPMTELSERLMKHKAPGIAVVDSFQYSGFGFPEYLAFKEKHKNKLLIFISHADGKKPEGRPAKKVWYNASLKIWIEGFKAYSHGRYIGPSGEFTIWPEGFEKYYGINQE